MPIRCGEIAACVYSGKNVSGGKTFICFSSRLDCEAIRVVELVRSPAAGDGSVETILIRAALLNRNLRRNSVCLQRATHLDLWPSFFLKTREHLHSGGTSSSKRILNGGF